MANTQCVWGLQCCAVVAYVKWSYAKWVTLKPGALQIGDVLVHAWCYIPEH